MTAIKFGTDGWRAIIAQEYTVENVLRVAEGTAKWMKENGKSKAVIGYDCRFAGLLFAQTAARMLAAYGCTIYFDHNFASTPMVSLGVVKHNADLGIVITASHNPPSYNGFKLKSNFGGPTIPKDIAAVEALVPEKHREDLPTFEEVTNSDLLVSTNLEKVYLDHVYANFDMEAIKAAPINLAYDAMYGAGQNALPKLLPDATLLHCDFNPSFRGQAPEPIHRNLSELSNLLKNSPNLNLGLANDGDADRIGMYDEDGNFVDSHHLLLLLLLYLAKYKEMTGKVIITFSVTDKMKQLADHFGLETEVTKIGFKYIAEIMTKEDVLVGGEESGGLAVKGHIPERDGIWMGLLIMEFMAKTGKSIKTLIQEVYDLVGSFSFDRDDLHITEELKQSIIEKCKNNPFDSFGSYKVEKIETTDGFKFYLGNSSWTMIRPSGTEPVLRVYAQAPNAAEVRRILDAVGAELKK